MSQGDDGKRLERLGIVATAIYLVVLQCGIPLAASYEFIQLAPLSLNEVGDFLAGAFGPLAIFWLVLGFFQQGRELRNSVATLNLQAEELKRSVEQQRELVVVSREAIDLERETKIENLMASRRAIMPRFEETNAGGSSTGLQFKHRIRFINHGANASNVSMSVTPTPFGWEGPSQWPFIKTSETIEACIILREKGDSSNGQWKVIVNFEDRDGNSHALEKRFKPLPRERGIGLQFLDEE